MRHVGYSEWDRRTLAPADGFQQERVREIDKRGVRLSNPFWLTPAQQLIYPCIEGVSVSKMHGARPIGRCGKWSCRNCGEVKKKSLISEIQHCRQEHRGIAVFSVLTWRSQDGRAIGKSGRPISHDTQLEVITRWYKAASEILGTTARCSIPEWHKSGVMHMNVVWFGVGRDFASCPIRNKRHQYDMRLQCGMCHGCRLRQAWTALSGAPRSTHEHAGGTVAGYVAKYLTKDTIGQVYKPDDINMKRYSFSRSVKRPPSIVPVYRWIGQTLRDNGLWIWGRKQHEADKRWQDYITDEGLFLQDESTYQGVSVDNRDGKWLERASCSGAHRGLCDRVPYWSPTKQDAWGGKHWEWFAKLFGDDTVHMLKLKINNAFEYILPRLEATEAYD